MDSCPGDFATLSCTDAATKPHIKQVSSCAILETRARNKDHILRIGLVFSLATTLIPRFCSRDGSLEGIWPNQW
jgi:hypothetical protein